jgi:hypothetical protein
MSDRGWPLFWRRLWSWSRFIVYPGAVIGFLLSVILIGMPNILRDALVLLGLAALIWFMIEELVLSFIRWQFIEPFKRREEK